MAVRPRSSAAAVLVLSALAPHARAQALAGANFQVNEVTFGSQFHPSVAVRADGEFVVVWGTPDGNQDGVAGRRFGADGAPIGPEFQVNSTTAGEQYVLGRPAVDCTSDGRFVVVFEGDRPGSRIVARRFDASANPLGPDFQVNTYVNGIQEAPSVALSEDGSFMVAWTGPFGLPLEFSDLRARFFDTAGNPAGPEFIVNPPLPVGNEFFPSVAAVPGGGYLLTWMGTWAGGQNYEILGQRFNAAGVPTSAVFLVNTTTTFSQEVPSIAMHPSGRHAVVWDHWGPTDPIGIWGQYFDSAGTRVGGEFRVNRTTATDQARAQAAFDDAGNLFVTWTTVDADDVGIFSQLVDGQGRALGPERQVNSYATSRQWFPSVGGDANGRIVVAWESWGQDGSGSGIYAQRLGGLRPTALSVDAAGNGVAEPGESARVAPTWMNTSGSAVTVTGAVSGFGGPAGGTYTIDDAVAAYGTLANGASVSCGADCYALTASGTRPAAHWDAQFTETLSTSHLWPWTLHLGDSFSDVPRANPFYRFVETLLHAGVTGGCSATTYCPSDPSTREQMAVYVLTAREDDGYAPPPCGTPVFADVPASSPYCRWIEELARRGVVSGCGGGNYCPSAPVTRQEMAVFVLRTLDPALLPPACAAPMFADVPASSPFCPWIEELARRGIVSGCGGGNYCPAAAVTREQMGVFVSVTFGLTLYGP